MFLCNCMNLRGYEGVGREHQPKIKQLCNWLSAPGSPAAPNLSSDFDAGTPASGKSTATAEKAKHGSQTWTSKRRVDGRAVVFLPDPPGRGLRCRGRSGPAAVHHPHGGGFLCLPWLVRAEAERTAVTLTRRDSPAATCYQPPHYITNFAWSPLDFCGTGFVS